VFLAVSRHNGELTTHSPDALIRSGRANDTPLAEFGRDKKEKEGGREGRGERRKRGAEANVSAPDF